MKPLPPSGPGLSGSDPVPGFGSSSSPSRTKLSPEVLSFLRQSGDSLSSVVERAAKCDKLEAENDTLRGMNVNASRLASQEATAKHEALALVEKLIHENRSLRGPVPRIEPGEFIPPAEVIEAAQRVKVWMETNGFSEWQLCGICDRRFAGKVGELREEIDNVRHWNGKLANDLDTERNRLAACGVVALADTVLSREEARKMHPDYRSASLSDVERRVDECIRLREELAESRAENGRQAATIAQIFGRARYRRDAGSPQ